MYKFLPYMTNDYSVGLYDESVNDIYHSAFGALTEAYEKFGKSVFYKLLEGIDLNILDICYGVGYNTKVIIQEALKTNQKLEIDCVDTNKILLELSPFIKTEIKFFDRVKYKNFLSKNISNYNEAKKIISYNKKKSIYKIDNFVNFIILKALIENETHVLSKETEKILFDINNKPFLSEDLMRFYEFNVKFYDKLYQNKNKSTFVHNIYYRYISNRYNKSLSERFKLNFYSNDIRDFLKTTYKLYDVVFLDGFTPAKCPVIWSVDLFKRLFEKLDYDGVIVTYNTSAPVRSAMINSGLFIGNIISTENKIIGTIASKNNSNLKYPLTKVQKGLLNTKAGIPYRDMNLSLDNDTIILNREKEVINSNLISSSKYLKEHKNEI